VADLNRSRLLNAVVFFAENVRACGKIKLFKLLYLLDFEHFRQTGKSVTGVEYQAWKFGPVPVELMEKWEDMDEDLGRLIHIEPEKIIDHTRLNVVVNSGVRFAPDDFTPRQLRIMEALVARFRDTYSDKMIDVTHEQNGAWDTIWQDGRGAYRVIPYELAVGEDVPEREALLSIARERTMYQAALNAARSSAPAA
jgi:uncharacterized phage-associated protein